MISPRMRETLSLDAGVGGSPQAHRENHSAGSREAARAGRPEGGRLRVSQKVGRPPGSWHGHKLTHSWSQGMGTGGPDDPSLAVRPQTHPGCCPGPRSSEVERGSGQGTWRLTPSLPPAASCPAAPWRPECQQQAAVWAHQQARGPAEGRRGDGPVSPALGGSCRPLVSLWRHCRKSSPSARGPGEPACLGQRQGAHRGFSSGPAQARPPGQRAHSPPPLLEA